MCGTRVLALLVLLVSSARSFSWDIVVGRDKLLEFYYNGTITHTEDIPSAHYIVSLTYDPVQYRLLFADRDPPTATISSFDISTKNIQRLVTTSAYYYNMRVVYDPVTQVLYWKEGWKIYSFSLNPASSNKADGNLLFTLSEVCQDIAVDSCEGYIYWITDHKIERAQLDGSKREVLIASIVYLRLSLAVDQQTQKIYWTEKTHSGDEQWSIESANFNGKNRMTLHIIRNTAYAFSLAVSKDFINWEYYASNEQGIWQLPKCPSQHVERKLHSMSNSNCVTCHRIATNYSIKEQIQETKSCNALQGLIPYDSKSEFTVSICQNYCFQGECSVSAEGQPTCSCKAGYSGERCEVNACHEYCLHDGICSLNEQNKRVCQCTAGYDGERCEVSICNEYCLQGNCSVSAEGQPKCSCKAGYSGDRCEVNVCTNRCSNNGVCSLNEEDEPICECTADYEGKRCDVAITQTGDRADNTTQQEVRYIYWITDHKIERAQLDGSKREVLIASIVYLRLSLAVDQQTQKIYWTEKTHSGDEQWSIESANFNGKNRMTLHIIRNTAFAFSLAVSKDFINWEHYASNEQGIWQLPKYPSQHVERKLHSMSNSNCVTCHRIATNYSIKEQIQETKSCNALQGLIPYDSKSESTVSICQNYCFQGECSVSAEGQPTCSCKAGYSGERCEVNACHEYCLHDGICSLNEQNKRVCQCTAGYDGERCEVSICNEYCLQGNCSVSAEGQPKCSCKAGYSGDRCEVNVCTNRCSNNGVCSLNEEDEPICECTADYEGKRCDVAITQTGDRADNTTQQEVRQVIKEELKRILQFFSDKLDEYEAKI